MKKTQMKYLTPKQKQLIEYIKSQPRPMTFREIVVDNANLSEAWVYRQESRLIGHLKVVLEYNPLAGRFTKCYKMA